MAKIGVKANYENSRGQSIKVKLQLITFEEDGVHFVYSPSLNLTGYDKSLDGARESFLVVLDEYVRYTTQ